MKELYIGIGLGLILFYLLSKWYVYKHHKEWKKFQNIYK